MRKKNILVTGGAGYKGSVLIPLLLKNNYRVYNIDLFWFGNNLEENKDLINIKKNILDIDDLKISKIDAIIHLAAIANDPTGTLNSKLTWETNVLGTMKLAEWAKNNKVKNFVYASSGSVYGVKKEKKVTEELPLVPISDYNKTKMVSEKTLLSYNKDFRIVILRPATVCGFSQRMRLDIVINMFVHQAITKKKITVLGGDQIRPNVHINDISNFYIYILKNKSIRGIYNISNENLSVKKIANLIKKKLPETKIITKKSNDPRSYRLDSNKSKKSGFVYKYNIKNSIEELINIMMKEKNNFSNKNFNLEWMKKKILNNEKNNWF